MENGDYYLCEVDQCQFGLQGPGGGLHRKRTWILTSSAQVAQELSDKRCDGSHDHEPVIGGSKITEAAGHYPRALARAIVDGTEKEFDSEKNSGEHGFREVNVGEVDPGRDLEEDLQAEEAVEPGQPGEGESEEEIDLPDLDQVNPTQAVMRLHAGYMQTQGTGHHNAWQRL